jgi:hypothetical protein
MVSRSLLGPHRKMYANTPTSTTRVQQHQCSTCCPVALALHQLHPCVATTRPRVASALHQQHHTSGCLSSSRSPSSTTAPMSCIWTRCLRRSTSRRTVALAPTVRPVTPSPGTATRGSVALALLRLRRASGCAVSPLDFSSVGHAGCCRAADHSVVRRDYSSLSRNESTSNKSRVRVPRHVTRLVAPLVVDYLDYAVRPGASAHRAARHAACRVARLRLLRLCRASGCHGTSRGSSHGSSSTASPRAGLLSTTVPMSCIQTRRLRRSTSRQTVALAPVVRPVTPSRGSATRGSVAPALLRLRCASGRVVSPLDFSSVGHAGCCRVPDHSVVRRDYLSPGRNESTSNKSRVRVPRHVARLITWLFAPLFVDYCAYAARPGASARRAACHTARRRLLRLRSASGCLGTSRGLSHGSSSTTSPTSRIQVPRHVVRLVAPLVVDYFD